MKIIVFTAPDLNGGEQWVSRQPVMAGLVQLNDDWVDVVRNNAVAAFKYYAKRKGIDMTADLDGMTYELRVG